MIERVCGACEIAKHNEGDKVKSPGVKYTHYKPKCDTVLFESGKVLEVIKAYNEELSKGRTPYIMCESTYEKEFKGKNLLLLGFTGEEVASNLYYKLLEGEKKADVILAIATEKEDGVYLGVMNRLRKSCG